MSAGVPPSGPGSCLSVEPVPVSPADAAAIPNAWQPMSSAPKDGTRVLVVYQTIVGPRIEVGVWFADEYAKKPRPWWSSPMDRLWGVVTARKNPPYAWQPLPAPPAARSGGEA